VKKTHEDREKKWQSLTLADDFLFSKIMSDTLLCAEKLHRIFPNLGMSEIKPEEASVIMDWNVTHSDIKPNVIKPL